MLKHTPHLNLVVRLNFLVNVERIWSSYQRLLVPKMLNKCLQCPSEGVEITYTTIIKQ